MIATVVHKFLAKVSHGLVVASIDIAVQGSALGVATYTVAEINVILIYLLVWYIST